jgi:hypothetical protein
LIEYGVQVIRLQIGAKTAGRSGRVGLPLGLVVLIAAHLAGAVHGSSFAGPHLSVTAVACSQGGAEAESGTLAPSPGHEHKADGHIDHAADRPRAAVDDTADEPDHDGIPLIPPAAPGSPAGHAAWQRPPGVPRSPDGRSTLTLHCVWRQ